jgi:hypothetical protein
MIERNGSDCKYVEICTHHVGSAGAPSRRTVFISGTNTKQREVLRLPGGTRRLTFSKREVQDLVIIIIVIIIITIIITIHCYFHSITYY